MLIPRAYTTELFRQMTSISRFGGTSIVKTATGLELTLTR
jgi:hypothetical protein